MTTIHNISLRLLAMATLLVVATTVSAQSRRDITTAIAGAGKVTITAPSGLTERNNDDLTGKSTTTSTKKAGDDDDVTTETKTETKTPSRTHTTQQTVQGRSMGFRIQVYNDNAGGKAEAQNRARTIAMKFPQYRTYITYNAPTWRLRIGDFKNQREAQEAISRVRAAFPQYARQMVVVRDNVNNWR